MRWRSLLEPCGSHHDEARALKCETSVALTEEEGWEDSVGSKLVLYVARLLREGGALNGMREVVVFAKASFIARLRSEDGKAIIEWLLQCTGAMAKL